MTTFIRDMSHYDDNLSLSGYAGTTHKITEGTGYVDPRYAARMPGFRLPDRVLGSYHVLHTADPAGQLQFWIEQQDKLTPWWRDWPHWIMQIDAEKWPDDPVTLADGRTYTGPLTASAFAGSLLADDAIAEARQARQSTTVSFATMLKAAKLPGLQICYASRGQFGDNLSGIPLDLWNAAYRSSSYPGDNSSDWRPYSGRTPVFWQYTSTPYDKNAFRGTVAELLAYVSGGEEDVNLTDKYGDAAYEGRDLQDRLRDDAMLRDALCEPPTGTGYKVAMKNISPASLLAQLVKVPGQLAALTAKVDALASAPQTAIPQEQLDLAVLNALKTLAGGQS